MTEQEGIMPPQSHTLPRTTPETSIASSIIPYPRNDDKARYLGYMACGFSVREALRMIKKSKQTLSLWRHDSTFVSLENRIPEFRKELSKEYIEIEFFRNFRLVLEHDYTVLMKAINKETLAKGDLDYLLRLRSQYSPQQLSLLEAVVSDSGDGFNFSRWVADNPDIIHMSRTDVTMVKK